MGEARGPGSTHDDKVISLSSAPIARKHSTMAAADIAHGDSPSRVTTDVAGSKQTLRPGRKRARGALVVLRDDDEDGVR